MQYALAYQLGARAGGIDSDAKNYIAAVEAADGQALEDGVKQAYITFVKGCKSDGIWDAIKASCIMAGARTYSGALVPLKGAAPTNFNFDSTDYNRKTGLVGNGSTKYLSSNRANNADPQNNKHMAAWKTLNQTTGQAGLMGNFTVASGSTRFFDSSAVNNDAATINQSASVTGLQFQATGFVGASRNNASNIQIRVDSGLNTYTVASVTPVSQTLDVFRASSSYSSVRLAFYSIGEALDLSKLETRISTLMSDFNSAIP